MPQVEFVRRVQDHINKGWGIAARHLGLLWNIYRAGNYSTPTYTNINFHVVHWRNRQDIEMANGSFVYRLMGDRKFIQPGDLIVGQDTLSPESEATTSERYTIVSMRVLRPNIAVRTDEACQIYRPLQSSPIGVGGATYNYEWLKNALQLSLNTTTNTYSFSAQPIPGGNLPNVYCGITWMAGGSYDPGYTVPLATPNTGWMISLPLLSGVTLQEEDWIVDAYQNLYRVERPYFQIEGSYINQLHCTRLLRV